MRPKLLALAVPLVAGLAALGILGGQAASDAAARLEAALERMEGTSARLELSAVTEVKGTSVLGGGFDRTIHGRGELVPPDRLHLVLDGAEPVVEMVIVGRSVWVDGGEGLRPASKVALGPLTSAQAPLEFVRGPGVAQFAGLGLVRGVVTYRVRMELDAFELQARLRSDQPVDPDTVGALEVEIGLFDGLLRRQTFEVVEPADPFSGTGLRTVRTVYAIEYWDHGQDLEVREPR